MKKRSIFSRAGSSVKNYTGRLIGIKMLRATTLYIADMFTALFNAFKKKESEKREFDEVVKELSLDENHLRSKKKQLLINCLVFFIMASVIFVYGCWHIMQLNFMTFVNYLLASTVLFALSGRMHYYHYLIVKRRLDLSYKDWVNAIYKGDI